MTSIKPQCCPSPANSSTHCEEAASSGESAFHPAQLTDLIHIRHISEKILPTLTLQQASLLARSSKELSQIIHSAFASTLPDIMRELNSASPAVRLFFKPIKLGSPGNLEQIRARKNVNHPDIHPALRTHAHRITRFNTVQQGDAAPSPLRNVIQNPD